MCSIEKPRWITFFVLLILGGLLMAVGPRNTINRRSRSAPLPLRPIDHHPCSMFRVLLLLNVLKLLHISFPFSSQSITPVVNLLKPCEDPRSGGGRVGSEGVSSDSSPGVGGVPTYAHAVCVEHQAASFASLPMLLLAPQKLLGGARHSEDARHRARTKRRGFLRDIHRCRGENNGFLQIFPVAIH